MKKKLAIVLLGVVALCLTACGGKKEEGSSQGKVAENALEIMQKVWSSYGEDQVFAAIGGDMANPVDNAPGNFAISDAESLDGALGFPAANVDSIDDCASIMHMMNANTFTGAAYHLKDAADATDVANAIKDNILARQWICGFPDKMIVVKVGDDYLVSAFGNAEVMDNFKTKLMEQYEGAEVLFEEAIG